MTKTGETVTQFSSDITTQKKKKDNDCTTLLSNSVSSLLSSVLVCFSGSSLKDTSTIVAEALSPKGAEMWLHCSARTRTLCSF